MSPELREEFRVREMDLGVNGTRSVPSLGDWMQSPKGQQRREDNLTEPGTLGQEEVRERWF